MYFTEREKECRHLLEHQEADRKLNEQLQAEISKVNNDMADLKKTKANTKQVNHYNIIVNSIICMLTAEL